MSSTVFALLSLAAGAAFCFAGYRMFWLIIPLWAGFIGFVVGAGLADALSSDGFLGTAAGWIAGFVCALAFALVSRLVFEVAVALAVGSAGFALWAGLMVALGIRWSWVVAVVALAGGIGLAVLALRVGFPAILLVVLTALGGASAIVNGIMLLTGVLAAGDFDQAGTPQSIDGGGWWAALFVVLAGAGVAVQLSGAVELPDVADQRRRGGRRPPAAAT